MKKLCVLIVVFRVTAKKLPGKFGSIKLQCLFVFIRRSPISRPHGEDPPNTQHALHVAEELMHAKLVAAMQTNRKGRCCSRKN
jgi:hypothetical protein